MPKAVIFDVDGTLIDLSVRAWVNALRDRGHEVAFENVRSRVGKGGDQLMPALLSRDELEKVGQELEEHRGRIFKEGYLPDATAFPGVRVWPKRVLVVGGTPYDAEAAGKAGLRTVGLLCSGFPEQALRNANCIPIYRDPADLLAQYDQSPLARTGAAS